jgi:hypothetical protein
MITPFTGIVDPLTQWRLYYHTLGNGAKSFLELNSNAAAVYPAFFAVLFNAQGSARIYSASLNGLKDFKKQLNSYETEPIATVRAQAATQAAAAVLLV